MCHAPGGRRWFRRNPGVPERWFPRDELDPDSFAFDVLFGHERQSRYAKIEASAWFDRRGAEKFHIFEQSIRSGEETLTILTILDQEMLLEPAR